MHTYPLLLTIVICSRISASRRVLTRWPGGYAFLALFLMIAPSAPTVSAAELKVLHVMSYHSPWRWTDRQPMTSGPAGERGWRYLGPAEPPHG